MSDLSAYVRTGDVLLFRGRQWHSRGIEDWTGRPYSHIGIVWRVPTEEGDRPAVIEALEMLVGGCVRVFPLDRYLESCMRQHCGVDWFETLAGPTERERVASYCLRQWGRPYVSLWQLLWSFVRLNRCMRGLFGFPSNLNPERWFCSELVAAAFVAAGLLPPDHTDPAQTDPGQVADWPRIRFRGVILS